MPTKQLDDYITSIDGLRAIAVLLVLLFHVDVVWFQGGFVGVDVFFVISGFLITRNILRDIERQDFSFSNFYQRRIARLFPALFVTIGLTLAAGYFILSPEDLERLGRVGVLSTLSVSNLFFWSEAGYFDASATTKPLLHTWSLAVEEQFYLIWPATLFLLSKAGRHSVPIGIAAICSVSLFAATFVHTLDAEAAFFLTPLRIYQLAFGAALACIVLCRHNILANALFVAGILAIVTSSVYVSDNDPYWFVAIMPALGAAAIIYGIHGSLSKLILATTPVIWLGRRSYSIYLIHWPIIVYWLMSTDYEFSAIESFLALIVSVVCGTLLYELVEKPFRQRSGQTAAFRNGVLGSALGLCLALLATGSHLWGLNGLPSRVPAEIASVTDNFMRHWDARLEQLRNNQCNFTTGNFRPNLFDESACTTPPRDTPSFLIIGDSFASDAYLIFKRAYPEVYFGQLTLPGCVLRMPDQITGAKQKGCRELYAMGLQVARNGDFDGVIMASNWGRGQLHHIEQLIDHLERPGFRVVVLGQRVRFKARIPPLIASSLSFREANEKAKRIILEEPRRVNSDIIERYSERVQVLDIYKLQTDVLEKVVTDTGQVLYLDDSHVSIAGAEALARTIRAAYPDLANH